MGILVIVVMVVIVMLRCSNEAGGMVLINKVLVGKFII